MTAIARVAGTTPPSTPAATAPMSLPGPSEPEHVPNLPSSYTPSTFHMGIGGQVGGGVLGFFGGSVAGLVGAGLVMWGNASPGLAEGPGADIAAMAVLGAAIIGGTVAGVFIDRNMQKSHFAKAELQRQDEQVGKPIDRFALEFLTPYDHSGDGAIQLKNTTGLPDRDEKLTFETQSYTTKSFHFDANDHDVLGGNPFGDTTTQHGTQQRAISAANVWAAADVNHDDTVTTSELSALSKGYDANKDGFLSAGERKQLTQDHPLLEGGWTVTEPAH